MDKQKYFKSIWSLGRLVVGYSELKAFDIKTALTFARINTEYNYAVKNNTLIEDYCFAYEELEIAGCIGLNVEDVKVAIKQLEKLFLIKTFIVDNCKLMHLELERICLFIGRAERENNYKLWDNGLNLIQSNAFKYIEFNEENRKLVDKKKIPELVLARDENGNIYSF